MTLLKYCPDTGVHPEASLEDIIAAFNDLPEWTRLRVAASVVDALDGSAESSGWDAFGLLLRANQIECEAAEKVRQAAEVEELAKVLYAGNPCSQKIIEWQAHSEEVRADYRQQARAVIAAGYRKQADTEDQS